MAVKRGALILFEGVDRCGKSTQCTRLVDRLNRKAADSSILHRFPDRTTAIGNMIDLYLRQKSEADDHAIHLLFSANRWEKRDEICRELTRGRTVVMDRYAFSGIAFSSAKGLDFEWCKSVDVGLPMPDIVFFLDLPISEAMKRGQFGEERYEKGDMQERVLRKFRMFEGTDAWQVLDARLDVDALSDIVYEAVVRTQGKVEDLPIATFK